MIAIALAALISGHDLYMTRCASCHGERAQGSSLAPGLIGKSASDIHLMLDTGRMPAAVPYVDEISEKPSFSRAQIEVLTGYVLTLTRAQDRTLPLVSGGDPIHGRALFAENCSACHGPAADGASVGANDVAPSLRGASAFQIGEAIRAGPDVMPRFGTRELSDRDVDDIARYVTLLDSDAPPARNVNAGGLALAHVGPVAEGFVAWFFGIGALLLFIRSIGTTR